MGYKYWMPYSGYLIYIRAQALDHYLVFHFLVITTWFMIHTQSIFKNIIPTHE